MREASTATVRRHVERSSQALGVPSLDLVQLYWHDYGSPRYVDAALALTELSQGDSPLIKHVGATNFDTPRLREMLDAGANI